MMQLLENDNSLEDIITIDDTLIAHCFCMFHPAKQQVQIVDLFATIACGIPDSMLNAVLRFAAKHQANEIVAYCGPEPFNPGKCWTLAEEMQFYRDHGFEHLTDVCGVTPCMVKTLQKRGDSANDPEHTPVPN